MLLWAGNEWPGGERAGLGHDPSWGCLLIYRREGRAPQGQLCRVSEATSARGCGMGSGSSSTHHLHANSSSGVFKGFPGRKLLACICLGLW